MQDGSTRALDIRDNLIYTLEPGFIYMSKRRMLVRAVLGSCVAVCLWDAEKQIGAMNHFIHAGTRNPAEATPLYGNVATIALLKLMQEADCRTGDIRAQVFGGAHPYWAGGRKVGYENARVARDILRRRGIEITNQDIGGIVGRKIVFDTGTGRVAVMKSRQIRRSDWILDRE